jgi:deoxycytidylate deaminase
VVARLNEVLSTGANDCPRSGGGLYWPEYDNETHAVKDHPNGRDYLRGHDFNRVEQLRIIREIVHEGERRKIDRKALQQTLEASRIRDLTEFSRAVHAEMEALLSCARNNNSTRGATLYSTTFPCHNCAKHIIASGIVRVVYIEPYPKSKTAEFHSDAVTLGFGNEQNSVRFEPFVGIGPRRFFDLFSMKLGSGYPLERKDDSGKVLSWQPEEGILRTQMLPCSYLELETAAAGKFNSFRKQKRGKP